ncbi:unnamed protein product [Trichogramma brassicae]|uniref:Uncharacterized protein n=1 Tax=Trichogramma brassicae TaxID=86971 RepID=A0A6H5J459_9HYME|nr:unnamed protein product [Trichogramma brassicae]
MSARQGTQGETSFQIYTSAARALYLYSGVRVHSRDLHSFFDLTPMEQCKHDCIDRLGCYYAGGDLELEYVPHITYVRYYNVTRDRSGAREEQVRSAAAEYIFNSLSSRADTVELTYRSQRSRSASKVNETFLNRTIDLKFKGTRHLVADPESSFARKWSIGVITREDARRRELCSREKMREGRAAALRSSFLGMHLRAMCTIRCTLTPAADRLTQQPPQQPRISYASLVKRYCEMSSGASTHLHGLRTSRTKTNLLYLIYERVSKFGRWPSRTHKLFMYIIRATMIEPCSSFSRLESSSSFWSDDQMYHHERSECMQPAVQPLHLLGAQKWAKVLLFLGYAYGETFARKWSIGVITREDARRRELCSREKMREGRAAALRSSFLGMHLRAMCTIRCTLTPAADRLTQQPPQQPRISYASLVKRYCEMSSGASTHLHGLRVSKLVLQYMPCGCSDASARKSRYHRSSEIVIFFVSQPSSRKSQFKLVVSEACTISLTIIHKSLNGDSLFVIGRTLLRTRTALHTRNSLHTSLIYVSRKPASTMYKSTHTYARKIFPSYANSISSIKANCLHETSPSPFFIRITPALRTRCT